MRKAESSRYINEQRRSYALYVMQQRAIPAATDGLKAGARRVLWTARDGKKVKSATLAGATMPIHPHAAPEGAIDTLAAFYGNNIPLFKGYGAFGTLLKPKAYGASRYTSVETSEFTSDVVLKDIEIIPMTENYDGTLMEPQHFLPLIPLALLNPSDGAALGYATNILPRALDDLIIAQITHLKGGKKLSVPNPKFLPLNDAAVREEQQERGIAYYFEGDYQIKDTSTLVITRLPYSQTHEKVIDKLDDLISKEIVSEKKDDSKRTIDITVKFKRGYLKDLPRAEILKLLGLAVREIENLNVLDFTGKAVWHADPVDFIRKFTDWRLGWYVNRYERERDLLKAKLQQLYDIRLAIKKNVSSVAPKTKSRAELKEILQAIGVVNLDYIADFPIYRFTEEEYIRNEDKIKEGEIVLQTLLDLLTSEDKRKKVYISELQEVLTKYTTGLYNVQRD
jgi:DNA gyrase/topoisomerase IV subunit A